MRISISHVAVRTTVIASAVGALGLVVGTSLSRAQDHSGHAGHAGGVREHYTMVQGPQGAGMAKEAMLKMAAHQYLLGEAAADPELKKLAQTPELKKAIEEVRASLKDRAALEAKKAELLKDHDEMMMIVAHALLKQDAETEKMLKAAEAGGGAATKDDHGAHNH